MRVWTNREFKGYWPVGTSAVVVAGTVEEAVVMLNEELKRIGLPQSAAPTDFIELDTRKPSVRVLQDGNY